MDAGLTGNDGIIGWYVPPWMAEEYPDIPNWENLNKYADMFETSESDGKGQLLDGDPSYVTNDEALVKNLDLDYKVVVGGSEAALIQSFQSARGEQDAAAGLLLRAAVVLQRDGPASASSCRRTRRAATPTRRRSTATTRRTTLNKLISTEFAESDSPAVDLIKNFKWTNEDQNLVSTYIAQDGMDPDDAAEKWVEENQDKVDAWLELTRLADTARSSAPGRD